MNGTNLPDGFRSFLTLTGVSASDAGDYRLLATAGGQTATSAVARITVSPVVIRTQPTSQVVLLSNELHLTVAARGTEPLLYQWMKDGAPLLAPVEVTSTSSTFRVARADPGMAGAYWVVASNPFGAATTAVAQVSVEARAPFFVVQPTNVAFAPAPTKTITLAALAQAGPPPTYQWYFSGPPRPGATASNLVLQATSTLVAGDYQLVAANALGKATSAVARVSVAYVAPVIYSQPLSATASVGTDLYLVTMAAGDPPPTTQWYFEGAPLPGAIEYYLPLEHLSANQAGAYYAVVSNPAGTETSQVATVTVRTTGPVFAVQPESQNALVGANVFLFGVATGPGNIEYQWRFNDEDIPGAVDSQLTLPFVTTNQAGRYTLVARNENGSTVSTPAVLTVRAQAPRFVVQPASATVSAGSFFVLIARAEAGPPPLYQWRFNGQSLPLVTEPIFEIFNVTPGQAGSYDVIAFNELGSATSAVAVLTVVTRPPQFLTQPQSQSVRAGESLFLSSQAEGTPPPAYQWWFNGAPLTGAAAAYFNVSSVLPRDAGNYTVVASNLAGLATSSVAVVTVTVEAPYFTRQPQGGTFALGDEVELSAEAAGAPRPDYQWLREGQPILHANDSILSFYDAGFGRAGRYRVVARNLAGAATSEVAVVTMVLAAPEFVDQPASQTVPAGEFVSFEGLATGGPSPAYQWYFNGVRMPGRTDRALPLNEVKPDQAGAYVLVAANAAGAATSEVATLTVLLEAPAFLSQPADQSLLQGSPLRLQADASGAPPPDFFWRKNGMPVPHQSSSVFFLDEATVEESGLYSVVASNLMGMVTSRVAVVTVRTAAPRFVQQPFSQGTLAGQSAFFSAFAEGGPPPTYQWQFQGRDIPNATSETLYLNSVAPEQAGGYTLLAQNAFGTATSQVATLEVNVQLPSFYQHPQALLMFIGGSGQLFAGASGAPLPQYQWRREGVDIPGAVQSFLEFTSATEVQAGHYTVTASNVAGVVTSLVALVTVRAQAPRFTLEPYDQDARAGSEVYLQAVAEGGPPPGYQWWFQGQPLPGETRQILRLENVSPAQAGSYFVLASNNLGMATSHVAQLVVSAYAPRFLAQPESQVIYAGDDLGLYTSVDSAPLAEYQWFFNNAEIPGARSSFYYAARAGSAQAGRYWLVASNQLGSATSEVATVTIVFSPPQFELDPVDQIALLGQTVEFSALALAAPPPSYQWQLEGRDLPGRDQSVLQLHRVTYADAGRYTVIASNVAGVATSVVAVLSVRTQAPEFLFEPQSLTAPLGSFVSLRGEAQSGPPPSYQWLFRGRPIVGATSSSLDVRSVSTNQAGPYALVAYNASGSVTSRVALLTVFAEAPFFYQHPASRTVFADATVSFEGHASAAPPPAYQWLFNGVPLADAHDPQLILSRVDSSQSGTYALVAANSSGAATSRVASLTVQRTAPRFVDEPDDQAVRIGGSAMFLAAAVGGPTPEYQWRFGDMDLPGATGQFFTFVVSSTNQAGDYSVVAHNALGAVTSSVARLTVELEPPEFVRQPGDQEVLVGAVGEFSGEAHGSPPPNYQWLFNGLALAGETNAFLQVAASSPAAVGGYSLVASSFLGSVTSRVARLVLREQSPKIVFGPFSRSVFLGDPVSFCVNAVAGPPPVWQWRFQGADIPGATNACLELHHVGDDQAGDYVVVVSNPLGSVTSAVAQLTVFYTPPHLYSVQSDQELIEGMDFRVGAVAEGFPIPQMLLQRNQTGLLFLRPTDFGFAVPEVSTNDAGAYSIVASNAFGVVTGQAGRLVVQRAGPLDRWARLNPRPIARDLFSVAYGEGRYVAVGDQGAVLSSTNAVDWSNHSLHAASELTAVAFGQGRFVAVGPRGLLLVSSNAVDWVPQALGDWDGQNVAFANGQFTVLARLGTDVFTFTSTDGQVWSRHTLPQRSLPFIAGAVAGGASTFVVISRWGDSFTSPDGIVWESFDQSSLGRIELNDLTFAADQFVAVGTIGRVRTSADGRQWRAVDTGSFFNLNAVAYGRGRFAAVGVNGTTLLSSNALEWTNVPSGTAALLSDVVFGGDRFVAVGRQATILVSSNGEAWQDVTSVTRSHLNGIAAGHEQVVVVGDGGTILTSTNGTQFVSQTSGVAETLYDVTFAQDRFVAVGASGAIVVSIDGRQWQPQHVNPAQDLLRAAYGNGRWLAAGRGVLMTSTDAQTWTEIASPGDFIGLAFGQGVFVAISDSSPGAAFASRDGLVWEPLTLYSQALFHAVGFAGDRFLMLARVGQVLSSADGYQWQAQLLDEPLFGYFTKRSPLIYARGHWLTVGAGGSILTSSDSMNWTRRVSPAANDLAGAVFFRGRFVVVGADGAILRSDPVGPALNARLTPAGMRLEIAGDPGTRLRLQASRDLAAWEDLRTLELSDEAAVYLDPSSNLPAHRFYRLIQP
ncbi:MAG TPA: immunoglobulin domain-containing protein [Candidatus Saccharimonadales bacterium]|nr:immunoglobulin domain-containing protein [Candidatus Saccharimonadales bacterium]